jgi:hypothetical protein
MNTPVIAQPETIKLAIEAERKQLAGFSYNSKLYNQTAQRIEALISLLPASDRPEARTYPRLY